MRFSVVLMTIDMSLIIIFLCVNFKIYITKSFSSLFSLSKGNLKYLSLVVQIWSQSYIYSASTFFLCLSVHVSHSSRVRKTVKNKADNILTLGLMLGYRFQIEINAMKLIQPG